jgi:hypothetical protein
MDGGREKGMDGGKQRGIVRNRAPCSEDASRSGAFVTPSVSLSHPIAFEPTHIHTHMRVYTRAHTHTRKHTHTHTHTQTSTHAPMHTRDSVCERNGVVQGAPCSEDASRSGVYMSS